MDGKTIGLTLLTLVVAAVGALGLVVVGGFVFALSAQVDALSERVAALEGSEPSEAVVRTRPGQGTGTPGAAEAASSTETDDADLEERVEREVARRERERKDERIVQMAEKGSAIAEEKLGELVDEGALDKAVADEVLELLVDEMYDTTELMRDHAAGAIDDGEAKEEFALIQEDYLILLTDLVGEDKAIQIRARVSGK